MGGLVASHYIQMGNAHKIDKLITMATPYEGSPDLLMAMGSNIVLGSSFVGNMMNLLGLPQEERVKLLGAVELDPTKIYAGKECFYIKNSRNGMIESLSSNEYWKLCEEIFTKQMMDNANGVQVKINNIGVLGAIEKNISL